MAKQYKIKRHKMGHTYRARPHPLIILLSIIGLAALVFIGISIYEPVYNFIVGDHSFFNVREPDPIAVDDPAESQVEPEAEPDPLPVVRELDLRTVYLPASRMLDGDYVENFLDSLGGTGINSVMIDIKDSAGWVLYNTANENAREWGAVAEEALDLRAFAQSLARRNLQLVVRLSAFSDQIAANGDRENAIRYQDSDWLWLDNSADAGGKAWLNPFAQGARDYINNLALEAVEAGASLVILQDVQFADNSTSENASFGTGAGPEQRSGALRDFVAESTALVEEAGARLAVYIPAGAATDPASGQNQTRYGGTPLHMAGDVLVLGLLPYQFTENYSQGGLEIASPLADPAATVTAAMVYVQSQLGGGDGQVIIPLLQGGNEAAYETAYSKEQIDAQIMAINGLGSSSYLLYSTGGEYLLQ